MGSISSIAGSLLQQTVFQNSGLTGGTTSSSATISGTSDNNQLSPLAKVLGELQALQQTDPVKYKDVTSQIAAKLQSAAQADTAAGNTSGAAQLNALSADFSTASSTGQLPKIDDLAKAIGGGHHHHHGHGGPPPSSPDSDSSSSTTAANQVQAAYQTSSSQSSSVNPLAIILNSLSN